VSDGEWDHRHPVFNKEAWDKMQTAEEEYLLANGWDRIDADDWDEPWGRSERTLSKGHAVNSQKRYDRMLQEGRPVGPTYVGNTQERP
jgi:hypothetical protein